MHSELTLRLLPAWARGYRREMLAGDLVAGIVVAFVLVPQAMAYALLAGLPPHMGLYAAMAPLVVYALLGSSATLSVGPVAIDSLMVAAALGATGLTGAAAPQAAAVLAAITGLALLVAGWLRLGALASFLSGPVVSGFVSAAALVIAASQLGPLLGVPVAASTNLLGTVAGLATHLHGLVPASAVVGVVALGWITFARGPLARLLAKTAGAGTARAVGGGAPLVAVLAGAWAVVALDLQARHGVATVGVIPAGPPRPALPALQARLWLELAPSALLIALVCAVESLSVARSFALRRRQMVQAGRELVALGAANLAAACTGGYNVSGGLARTSVNFAAGAVTPLASVVSAALVVFAAVALAPLLALVPRAVLAAIVVNAVLSLVEVRAAVRIWHYDRADGLALACTFVVVLAAGVQQGILAGVGLSLALHLWRTSRPHIAVVGRVGDTEHFRNVLRHKVRTCPHVLAVRIDESLYFASARALEERVLAEIAAHPQVRDVVLVASAINVIDASALETLTALVERLREAGVTFHLAEVKGPVMDRLRRTDFLERLQPGRVFMSTHEAMCALEGG